MRTLVLAAAFAIGGCDSEPCPDPEDYSDMVLMWNRDPGFIEREGSRLLDAGRTDACGSPSCPGSCALGTMPAEHSLPGDAGVPDASACPAMLPAEGSPCAGPMKCNYVKGTESCTAACSEFDAGRTWLLTCGASPPGKPAEPCPTDRPVEGTPCPDPNWKWCQYPTTGVCVAVNVMCRTGGWRTEECLASPTEARAVLCYGSAHVCPSIE